MSQFGNVMEIFSLLEKNNCRKCGEKTCMAFAASVFMGSMQLEQCPSLSAETTAKYMTPQKKSYGLEEDFSRMVEKLKAELGKVDFRTRAEQIGAAYSSGRIALKIMGKTFEIDTSGKAYTDLHVNSWVYVTVLNYIIHCQGLSVDADWVPLRELSGGQDWYRLFGRQCEMRLKKTADMYPDLFADLVDMFSGKQIVDQFQSDVGVVLMPLPLVPMLICYWRPEEGMESSLNLFFDATADRNLGMDGLYLLGTGIARMLEKLALQHGSVGCNTEYANQ